MKIEKQKLKKMYTYQGYQKKLIQIVSLIIVGFILNSLILPFWVKQILDVQIPNKNLVGVILIGSIMIGLNMIDCVITLRFCILRLNLRLVIQRDLKQNIFEKLQKIPVTFLDKNTTGRILQFIHDDTDDASRLFPRIMIEMLVMGIMRASIVSILLLWIDFYIGIGIIVVYLIGYSITFLGNKKTMQELKNIRSLSIEIYNRMNEGIQGFVTIKTLAICEQRVKSLEDSIQNYTKESKKVNKITSRYEAIFSMITAFALVWFVFIGTMQLEQGIISYGVLMIVLNWMEYMKRTSKWTLKHLSNVNKSYLAFAKILDFLEIEEIEELDKGEPIEEIKKIEFQHVDFSYSEKETVIRDFNLIVNKPQQIALVGKTGSGKSTIINMICRFYEPTNGSILINGKKIQQYQLQELRSKIGYVMQDVIILKNTIIDNMRYANPNITIAQIQEIFKTLQLHDKIMSLKDNYETNIYENETVLSKGEKQLLNFARIMAMNPDIILLDEVTSCLSYSSELLLKHAMEEITKDKICFIIAHRLSTIRKCDKILVMEAGRIVEQGTHEELLEKKDVYYQLVHKLVENRA